MSDYSFLINRYPEFVTKDQLYRICHISKKTALYYLENGVIPCIDSGKKTRRYKIAIKDIIFFLQDRDKNPEKYYLPNHFNNHF
jgi:intergrase/recombinase